jgi:hypothetical protein
LQHHLGDENRVRIARAAPGEVPCVLGEPLAQPIADARDALRGQRVVGCAGGYAGLRGRLISRR